MKREVKKQRVELWLLALVLALALTWYTLNPAAGTPQSCQREDDPPDAKQRQAGAQTASGLFKSKALPAIRPASARGASFEELSDWPEYLDLD
jgi:hypothetical protein